MTRTSITVVVCLSLAVGFGCAKPSETLKVGGIEGRYSLKYRSQSRANIDSILKDANRTPSAGEPTQEFVTDISGVWNVAPLENSVYEIRLDDVKLSVTSDGKSASGLDDVKRALSQDFFAKITPEGRVEEVLFGPSWGGNARDIAKSLLSMAQFVRPNSNGSSVGWQTVEDYLGGKYFVKYAAATGAGERLAFTKDRTSSLATQSAKAMMAAHRDPSGTLRCELSKQDGIVQSISGEWNHSIYVGENKVGTEAVTFELRRLDSADAGADAKTSLLAYAAKEPWHSLDEFVIPPDQKLAMAKQTLGTATRESLLGVVAGLRGKDASSADMGQARLQLMALFQVDPVSPKSFVDAVAGTGLGDGAFQVVLQSLLGVGSPEAQSSIVAIGQASQDHDVRGVIVSSLVPIDEPTDELVGFVLAQTKLGDKKLAQASWMSAGVLASALSRHRPAEADKLVTHIQREWEGCKDPADRAMMVLALGNTASVAALPCIRTSLEAKDAGERRMAIQALAKFPGAETLSLLKERALLDDAAMVRAIAIDQMRWQEYGPEVQAILVTVLENDREASVRLAAVRFLSGRVLTPELASVLHRLAASDSSDDVRKGAAVLAG